ncbi:hypothetical protein FHW69_001632 [Luteibacter sp. Sphag1AF]|uniref:hypothetical protein n=1 Tax=Luteibacter sp. Sphag1AF TaxID=2587031 RepID=UPI001610AA36|nr:hypothetical protein [Luteibacter sp. Sphag1AF]MBB3227031.1 hypothetical protein [Luteibacter sp. Sphag1AF]
MQSHAYITVPISYVNAANRLIETSEVIRDSMSIADQQSLHARLRSDIDSVKWFDLGDER